MKLAFILYLLLVSIHFISSSAARSLRASSKNSKSHDIPIYTVGNIINHDYFIKTYSDLTIKGQIVAEDLKELLADLILSGNLKEKALCLVAPLKDAQSLKRKLASYELKTKGEVSYYDFETIKDLVRSSVIFKSKDNIYQYLETLKKYIGNDINLKDRFEVRLENQYRDINVSIKSVYTLERHPLLTDFDDYKKKPKHQIREEIQLHLCGIFLANQKLHASYEARRVLNLYKNTWKDTLRNAETTLKEFDGILEKNIELAKMLDDESAIFALRKFKEDLQGPLISSFEATWLKNILSELDGRVFQVASYPDLQEKCFALVSEAMKPKEKCTAQKEKLIKAAEEFIKIIANRLSLKKIRSF